MPAESKSQQRLFGMVHAYQKGELKGASPEVKSIAKEISPSSAEHFAATKHDGLPEHVKKSALQNFIADVKKGPDKKLKTINREDLSWKKEAIARGFMKAAMAQGVHPLVAVQMLKSLE